MQYVKNLNVNSTTELKVLTVEEIYWTIIHHLGNSKCLYVFGINASILKLASTHICEVLSYLINLFRQQSVCPNKFKLSNVICRPIGENDTSNAKFYRFYKYLIKFNLEKWMKGHWL